MLLDALLEIIAPTRCAGCDLPGAVLCDACRARSRNVDRRWACPLCGAPFGTLTCTECWDREHAFSAAIALGTLERPLSRVITMYKDAGERRLAGELGGLLADALEPWRGWGDAVVWIPSSRAAIARRGFDHAEELAARTASRLALPLEPALAHLRALDQRGLSRDLRRANAAGSLTLARAAPVGNVILLDDVMTTGATLDAAAEALLRGGAAEVRAAVLARAW